MADTMIRESDFEVFSKITYFIIALALMLLALALVVTSVVGLIAGVLAGRVGIINILQSVGLIIVSVAIFDVGRFLVEEEVFRDRELRSVREARRSLTKFMTIIIIAASLEALVIVFETKQEVVSYLLYPSVLLASAVLALIGLSVFVWLSSKADALMPGESAAVEAEAERQDEPLDFKAGNEAQGEAQGAEPEGTETG
jgi:hypothetical protein